MPLLKSKVQDLRDLWHDLLCVTYCSSSVVYWEQSVIESGIHFVYGDPLMPHSQLRFAQEHELWLVFKGCGISELGFFAKILQSILNLVIWNSPLAYMVIRVGAWKLESLEAPKHSSLHKELFSSYTLCNHRFWISNMQLIRFSYQNISYFRKHPLTDNKREMAVMGFPILSRAVANYATALCHCRPSADKRTGRMTLLIQVLDAKL